MNYFTANRTSDKCQFQTKAAYRFNVLVREMGRIPFVALLNIRLGMKRLGTNYFSMQIR
jgi:hypothetical protein